MLFINSFDQDNLLTSQFVSDKLLVLNVAWVQYCSNASSSEQNINCIYRVPLLAIGMRGIPHCRLVHFMAKNGPDAMCISGQATVFC